MSFQQKSNPNLPIITSYVIIIIATSICTIFGIIAELTTVTRSSSHLALGLGLSGTIFSSIELKWIHRDQHWLAFNKRKKLIIQISLAVGVVASLICNSYVLIDLKLELSQDPKDDRYISIHVVLGVLLAIITCFSCILLLYLSINHQDSQEIYRYMKTAINGKNVYPIKQNDYNWQSNLVLPPCHYQLSPNRSCQPQVAQSPSTNVINGTVV